MGSYYRYRRPGRGGGVAVLAVIVIVVASGATPKATRGAVRHADAMAVSGASPGGGTLSCRGLEALWESAGGSPGAAFTAAEIAMAESSGQQYATMHNTNGTTDRGYFQINSIWGALSTYDAAGNARAAVQISRDGTDWGPWTTYQTGAYQGKC
jgi:hypothetical protein